MLISKTHFFKEYTNPTLINVTSLKNTISKSKLLLHDLTLAQEKLNLPSFHPKKERYKEVTALKSKLTENISFIEKSIQSFEILPLCKEIRQNLKTFFSIELQNLIYKLRETQQSFLINITNEDVFDVYDDQVQETIPLNETKNTIFQLTTMLMELRMAVVSQSLKLDRIDFFLNRVNDDIRNTNKELLVLPKKGVYFKNKIIYFLMFVVVLLMVLSLIKVSKNKGNKNY